MLFPSQSCRQDSASKACSACGLTGAVRGVVLSALVALVVVCSTWAPAANAEYFVPTSLGGTLNYGYGYSRIALNESEQTSLTLAINGGGFFWQPWFLTMGAGIGLGLSESDSNTSAGSTAKTASGSIDLTLFPESRFPTNFGFSLTDSRQELQGNLTIPGQHYEVRRFYLRQTYNALNGMNVNAWYFHNSVSVAGQSDESMDQSLGFQAQKRQRHHDFDLSGNYLYSDPAMSEVDTANTNLTFTHNYSPSAELGVSSLVSYANAKTHSNNYKDFNFSYQQVTSSFYWRPEHRPYQVSGGALFSTSGTSNRRIGTNANALYRFTRNINAGAGITVGVSDSDGQQTVDSTQSASVNAFSDQYVIMGFDYGWNTSLGLSNTVSRTDGAVVTSSSTETRDAQAVNVSLGHRISRGFNLGRSASLSFSAGQGVGTSKTSTSDELSSSLSNSASVGWNHYGFGGSTSANASVSDSRTIATNDSSFQVFSAQLSRAQEITRLSNLSGNINYQASRSARADELNDEEIVTGQSASATFNYSHARFLGLHGLQFSSQLLFPSIITSDNTAARSGNEWNNTLSYRVGLLSLSMTGRVAEIGEGERAYSMSFQAMRSF